MIESMIESGERDRGGSAAPARASHDPTRAARAPTADRGLERCEAKIGYGFTSVAAMGRAEVAARRRIGHRPYHGIASPRQGHRVVCSLCTLRSD